MKKVQAEGILTYNDYRDFINAHMYGQHAERGLQAKMARAMECQASYLVQVAKGAADFTEDQAYRLAKHLQWNELETDYFFVLLRLARAGTPELKSFLQKKRKEILLQSEKLEKKVGSQSPVMDQEVLARYFSNSIPTTVHIATSSPNYRTANEISKRLALPIEIVKETLDFLVDCKLIKKEKSEYSYSGESLHLPRTSSLNQPHQVGRRIQAIRSLQQDSYEDMHFSSIFTLDASSLQKLKEIFTAAVEESHKTIHRGGNDEIYSITLDLFKVI